jgi:ribonuclease-3
VALADRNSLVAFLRIDRLKAVARRPDLKKLQERIGYQFRDKMLLSEALTHSSAAQGQKGLADYERLEFLGDRVLGLAIAEYLFDNCPDAPGELAGRFNNLVNKTVCAAVAEELDLGPYIKLSDSEALAGGRKKPTILADTCEALLAAIYRDGGWDAVKAVIINFWASRADEAADVPPDAKTALQEWVQGRGNKKLPRYVKISRSGPDHAPLFVYEVRVESFEAARGEGPSRRVAEQAAAAALLLREGVREGGK